MEKTRIVLAALAMLTAAVNPAFAAQTTRVYSSGVVVLVFLGFCALVVVAQLIPAILTLIGMLKASSTNRTGAVEANHPH